MTEIAVVIGNYEGATVLADCLESASIQTLAPQEVIVVDAGSSDESVAIARRHGARVIETENRGLGHLYNLGASVALADYVFVANNDVALAPTCLDRLAEALDADASRFAADPTQLDWSGERVIHARTLLRRGPLLRTPIPGLLLDPLATAASVVTTVSANAGAMLLRRRMLLELSGFDESFFMDFEDLDLCWRAWLRGWPSVYVPTATVRHKVGVATKAAPGVTRLASSHENILRFALKCLPASVAARAVAGELVRLPVHRAALRRALPRVARDVPRLLRQRRALRPSRDLFDRLLELGAQAGITPTNRPPPSTGAATTPSFRHRKPATVHESPALRPPPGNPRFPLLDSLRAVAILLVVAFHAGGTAGANGGTAADLAAQGFSGVMIFFALSGFLIYRPFVAARDRARPAPGLRRFWRRRALRILPAYWLALTLFAAAGAINDVFTARAPVYYLFGQIYSERTFGNGIQVAWSLGVEMSFYALLPAYAWLIGRTGSAWPRAEAAALATITAVALAWRGAVHVGWLPPFLASALPGMAIYFVVGMALAAASVRLHGREEASRLVRFVARHPDACWAGALAAYVVAATAFGVRNYTTTATPWLDLYGNYLLCAVVAALLIAPAVFGQDGGGGARWTMRRPALAWLGLVSYGIFLWHLPPLVKLHAHLSSAVLLFAAALAVATLLAAASYYALELPMLRLKEPRRGQRA